MARPSNWLLLLGIAACRAAAGSDAGSEPSRPRGVGPAFAHHYTDPETFTCISRPDVRIPASAVNDDYCDCPDGSDEPGTSACAYLSPLSPRVRDGINDPPLEPASPDALVAAATPLPGFYCANEGHRPAYISHVRVNDGVCDYDFCCDGSDEWARPGGVVCEDRCAAIGAAWRAQDEQRRAAHARALSKRAELLAQATEMRAQVETRLAALQEEMGAARARVAALQDELEQVRAEERVRAKNTRRASNPAAELAGQARARVEALRQALLDVQRQRDESRALATEAEMILSKLKEEHNPNFNDEGVKAAVRAYEDFAARASGAVDYTRENEINEIARPDGTDHGIDFAQWEGGEVEQPRTGFVACIPDGLYNFMQSRWEPVRSTLVSNGILADTSSDADLGNSKAVQKAESAVRAAESTLNAKERDHRDQQQKLDKDYGPNHIFRPLEGQCISRDSGEYTYELCWLARTTQRSKKGGASSNMGDFKEFTTVAVDEVDADTGKVATVQRLALRYADGAHCWNGPSRSTLVVLQCGEADEIVKVSEDEKCVYSMQVRTPAACEEPDNGVAAPEAEDSTEVDGAGQGFAGSVKDEL